MTHARSRRLLTLATAVLFASSLFLPERASAARGNCKEIKGNLSEVVNGNLTTGTITNGRVLNGTVESLFTSGGLPTPDPTTYSYTRSLLITTNHGQLKVNLVGMGDYGSGLISELGRIDGAGSTGRFAGATGAFFTSGKSTDVFASAQLQISGEICYAN